MRPSTLTRGSREAPASRGPSSSNSRTGEHSGSCPGERQYPGATLYRWSYRRKKPNASWKERAAQKEEELPREEIEQRGELAEQALRAAYDKDNWPKGFQGQVYLPVDCR